MIGLLVIIYVVLTIVMGIHEANYLTAQYSYWDSVPIGDYEFYEHPGEVRHSFGVWFLPISIIVCYIVLWVWEHT